ncbi:MAG: dihydrolipoamide acetyltransferase family protein [Hyphomicrobiales bacterium]
MSSEVTMPMMGADMTEGTLVRWVKQVGEHVEKGEVIAEIETDKATVELEAFESGTVLKHVVDEGETVPVGEVIALLGEDGETPPDDVQRKPPAETPARRTIDDEGARQTVQTAAATAEAPATTSVDSAEEAPPPPPEVEEAHAEISPTGVDGRVSTQEREPVGAGAGERLRVSPVARRIANEAGIELTNLRGSGPDGRILRRDVEAAIQAKAPGAPTATPTPPKPQPAPRPAEQPAAARPAEPATGVQPLSRMRQAIARRMVASKQNQPHYYLTLDIDMTDALAFRQQVNSAASEEQRVSINDLLVKAVALALQRHPKFNAEYTDEGIRFHEHINIDIAIALDEGLIAPAVLECERKSLGTIAAESKELIERAKNGRLTAEEYSEGTFAITNLGAFGVETLIGIIKPPQAAILGVGSVMPQAVVRDNQVVVRQVMKVALSADHRVTDGAEGARFIKEIQKILENPWSLAL